MCLWVRAMDLYARVARTVEPKRERLVKGVGLGLAMLHETIHETLPADISYMFRSKREPEKCSNQESYFNFHQRRLDMRHISSLASCIWHIAAVDSFNLTTHY